MLSEYINSCESIRTAMGNNGTGGQGVGSGSSTVTGSSQSQRNSCSTGTVGTCLTSICHTTGVSQTNICQQTKQASSATQPQARPTDQNTNNKCGLQEFCDKVSTNNTTSTCIVLEEIKKECKSECNNICVDSDEKCTEFIRVTMEYCKEEAKNIILQLNKDLSPELVNTIILKFIGLQLYLRIIQELCLLRDYFTKIIENLTENCDRIKKCTCGNTGRCCTNNGKCLCTIFYKLFKAIKILHDIYCKIISYMKGKCDVDLYKVIPSLSLTRSIIILTKYFNDYVDSSYMVEESGCGCGKNETKGETECTGSETPQAGAATSNGNKCCCHRYSSKLDDVVTLLLGGIEDTDDCDGLLSDVISMISPFVKVECVDTKTMDNNPNEEKKTQIEAQLQKVISQKNTLLKSVINGINEGSSCGGTTVSSVGAGTSSTTTCASCDTAAQTSVPAEGSTTTCSGTIASDCSTYTTGDNGTTCAGSGPNTCTCNCAACNSGRPGECCCFYKCTSCPCEDCDEKSKTCLMNLVKKLKADNIKCNGDNSKDCLMSYLCVLKCSVNKLKTACTVTNGANVNLHDTLKNLPTKIMDVVDKICGTADKECCNKCTEANCCNEGGTCKCDGKCCEVNDRYSNFTKFLLGTNSTETKNNNNCKTITDTLIKLNKTLNTFLENGERPQNGCTCSNSDTQNCTNKCCCGTNDCSKGNGCKENKPINILSCVIECELKGIKERSTNIVEHITKIKECLKCIQTRMTNLEKCYCSLHNCISDLGKCVKDGKSCIEGKINSLKDAKEKNQTTFKAVITKSSAVLSDICGLYRVYSIESYSYYLSPYYHPIFPHNKQFILPCINNLTHIYFSLILN